MKLNNTSRRLAQALLLFAVIASLCACASERLPTREANAIAGKSALTIDHFGVCWPDFDRSVVPSPIPPANPGEFIAGYNNHVRPGQSCHTQESFAFNGAFKMNLAGVHNMVILDARLLLDRRNTPTTVHVERPVPSGVVVENLCPLTVEIATADWSPGISTGDFPSRPMPGENAITIQQDNSTIGVGVGVQWAVQQWVLGRLPNFGFVIKPRPGDIGKNENTCTGYWSNPRLEITVARPADH